MIALLLVPRLRARRSRPPAKYVGRPITDVAIEVEGKPTIEPALVELLETRVGARWRWRTCARRSRTFTASADSRRAGRCGARRAAAWPFATSSSRCTSVTRVEFRRRARSLRRARCASWMTERFGETPPVGRAADVAAALERALSRARLSDRDGPRRAADRRARIRDRAMLVFDVDGRPAGTHRATSTIEGTPLDPKERVLAAARARPPGKPYDRAGSPEAPRPSTVTKMRQARLLPGDRDRPAAHVQPGWHAGGSRPDDLCRARS